MGGQSWEKRLAAILAGGLLIINTTAVFAAPVELSLADSIALALKNNPAVKVALADRENAVGRVSEAKTGKQPALNYEHSANYRDTTDTFVNQFTLTLPLYTGGKTEGLIEQSQLGLKVTDLGVAKAKQQVKLDATVSYFNVLQARNMVKVNQESVDSLTAHLENVQAQYKVGTVAKSDVLRSEVELANAKQNLIKAQNNYDLAVASLNNVIGLPLDSELSVKQDLKYEKYILSLDDSIQLALKNRPEAAQADANIEIAKQGIKVAKSGRLPTVAFEGVTGWTDRQFSGTSDNFWEIKVSADLNLFDSGLAKAKIKQANAGLDKAKEQARQTKDAIELEVRQAYLSMNEAEKRIETSRVAVNKAEEDFKIAQLRYNTGVGTNLDVIDAQVALIQAKTNYIQALYDYNVSKAKLDKAMGI